mmetsp:Transcript_71435/g.220851  ORF Transcript_71435/g.220851 Transcript_71435/m.220851 type:complete len:290 (+) Transcript_71435:129-998(+)
MQERVKAEADEERHNCGPDQRLAQSVRVLGRCLLQVLVFQVVAEDVACQVGHHEVPHDSTGRSFDGRVPRYNRTAALRGHDLRHDRPVHPGGAPGGREAEEDLAGEEQAEVAWLGRDDFEDDVEHGNGKQHRDLRGEGSPVERAPAREEVADDAAAKVTKPRRKGHRRREDGGLDVRYPRRLEVQGHEAHGIPGDDAEHTLGDDDQEGRQPQESDNSLQLLPQEAAPALPSSTALALRLLHEQLDKGRHQERDQPNAAKGQAPAMYAVDELPGQRRRHQVGHHLPHVKA